MKMASKLPFTDVDDEYIEMELSSSYSIFIGSPPRSNEFEFQKASVYKESSCSPADELFYKGKLLPLHLRPRLQMLAQLHLSSQTHLDTDPPPESEHKVGLPFTMESCNKPSSESCRFSSEPNPNKYICDWSTEPSGFLCNHSDKSCSINMKKLVKQFSLGQKLKASQAYLKYVFRKSCNKSSTHSPCNGGGSGQDFKGIDCLNKNKSREVLEDDGILNRRSFIGMLPRHSQTKSSFLLSTSSSQSSSSSSSFSFSSSNGFYDSHLVKRSSSSISEIEGTIEAAIAHCRQSQQPQYSSGRNQKEVVVCSLCSSRI